MNALDIISTIAGIGTGVATGSPYVGMTTAGGIKSLFGADSDPYEQNRKPMLEIMEKIEAEFPKLAQVIKDRASVQASQLRNRMQDVGAAGGLPRNVVAQNMLSADLGVRGQMGEQLGKLDVLKMNTLQDMAGLAERLPPKPEDWSGAQLLGTGIQGLDKIDLAPWLQKLLYPSQNKSAVRKSTSLYGGFPEG